MRYAIIYAISISFFFLMGYFVRPLVDNFLVKILNKEVDEVEEKEVSQPY
jgi:hypothetical protein